MDGAHNLDIDVSTCARLIPPPGTVARRPLAVCRCRCRGGAGSSVAGDNGMLNYCHCPIVIEMMLRSYQDYCADIASVIWPVNITHNQNPLNLRPWCCVKYSIIMVDNQHRRIIRRPLWHCEPCEQKLRGRSSDLTDWSEAGLMVWWMYRPMDLILGSATCGVTATLCGPATHLHNIGFYQQNTQSPCSSKYWFRYLMCVVLRLYWRWQF